MNKKLSSYAGLVAKSGIKMKALIAVLKNKDEKKLISYCKVTQNLSGSRQFGFGIEHS